MVTRIAKCTCGQLQIAVEGEPLGVGVCHCFACQSRTGSVFAALAAFGPDYKVSGRATDYIRTGDQGARFRFRFCPVCGSNLYHTEEGEEHRSVAVAVGAFADPDFPPPQDSVYDCRRHSWVKLPDGVTVYEKDPE
ncbi:GFA family protein [Rhizobium sp. SIMBA_035]